jgi:hypothetical protein
MTNLQLGLIVAGIALVVGVIIFNWVQERRVRRRIESAFRKTDDVLLDAKAPAAARGGARVEPTLAGAGSAGPVPANAPGAAADDDGADVPYELPIDIVARAPSDAGGDDVVDAGVPAGAGAVDMAPPAPRMPQPVDRSAAQPDPDIECIVTLQPVAPAGVGAIAAGLHARVGRPLRWFGRRGPGLPWHLLRSDSGGEFTEFAACLLLADRGGAASAPVIDAFVALAGEIAPTLPAAFVAPDAAREAERAEALDRICGDLDIQIGLTVLKTGPATIAGTRLRGVAEAAGFRLVDGGRFDWIQEDTGAVLYSLQDFRGEPFTVETLRATSTPGAVYILDVPRVPDPVRAFDQMKLAAKRMAQTLDATLVDDNRRPLDDAALAAIRHSVQATATALREMHIEPGSPRALALFGG